MPNWLHVTLTVASGIASYAASTLIPASLLIPGIGLPVAGLVQLGIAVGAAYSIDGSKVRNTLAAFLTKPKAS